MSQPGLHGALLDCVDVPPGITVSGAGGGPLGTLVLRPESPVSIGPGEGCSVRIRGLKRNDSSFGEIAWSSTGWRLILEHDPAGPFAVDDDFESREVRDMADGAGFKIEDHERRGPRFVLTDLRATDGPPELTIEQVGPPGTAPALSTPYGETQRSITVRQRALVLGKRPDAVDVRISTTPGVSGRHAEIQWRDGAYWLRDMGTAGGTFVGPDDRPLAYERSWRLSPGERIRLERVELELRYSGWTGS